MFRCVFIYCVISSLVLDHQAVNLRHNKAGETDEPAMYRIKDDLVTCQAVCSFSSLKFFSEKLHTRESIDNHCELLYECRIFLLRYMNGLERAGSHMWPMMFRSSSI